MGRIHITFSPLALFKNIKKMKRIAWAFAALTMVCSCGSPSTKESSQAPDNVKTTFQSGRRWSPTIDNRADAVMVYGVGGNPSDKVSPDDNSFENRIESWRERGYITHFMTGIAWGGYEDYFTGKWDGKPHLDEGQVTAKGDTIWHGRMVPYIVPSENYLKYFKERHIKRVIDAGVTSIFLEEPEFWARGGYSESFKKEWQDYYGSPWRPQDESPEATYLSNKLKYHLYYRALDEAFTYAKEYGKSKGLDVKCYVPTHSLLNYTQWQIVSPEASLASLPCVDGYIAQVWTGTSRALNWFNGTEKERVFETAYLEYGCMRSMTEPTGRKVWFLTDPIEDWPRDWEDYRRNYHATFAAQLLYPGVADYEIMPWPGRIYEGLYRKEAGSEEKTHIPQDYATMMQVMINALHDIPVSDNQLSGTHGISVLMANSLMFQRFPTHEGYNDPELSNFYGLAMPLVKKGVPVGITHIENLGFEKALGEVKVLLMSYSNMKPLDSKSHSQIAKWVKNGGVLIYSGRDDDPFQSVQEWWNTGKNHFAAPSDHLFSLMGIGQCPEEGEYSYGKGTVRVLRFDPKEYVLTPDSDESFVSAVKEMYENKAKAGVLEFKNSFKLERGPYTIVAVIDEGVDDQPLTMDGCFIDLFDSSLPVCSTVKIEPGNQGFYYDVSKADSAKPQILAAASRAENVTVDGKTFSFTAKGPVNTVNASRILLPSCPESVLVNGKQVFDKAFWDETSHTYLLGFDNDPDGVETIISW